MNRWCCTFTLPALAALLLLVPPVPEVVEQAGGWLVGWVRCRRVFRWRQARHRTAFSMRHKTLKGRRAGQIPSSVSSRPRPALKLPPLLVAWLRSGDRDGEALQVWWSPISFNIALAYALFLLWKEIKEGNLNKISGIKGLREHHHRLQLIYYTITYNSQNTMV